MGTTDFFYYLLTVIFVIVCLFMVLLILIQKGRGGGLASAFGGAGGHSAFGSKTGDVLTWATSVVFGIFILLAVAINLVANHRHELVKASKTPDALPAPVQGGVPVSPAAPGGPTLPEMPGNTPTTQP